MKYVKIQNFEALDLQSPLYDAREVFFVLSVIRELEFSDILTLKWKNVMDDKISIRMRKTEKPLVIPMNDYIKTVLNKRRFVVENNGGKITSEKYDF